MSHSLWLIVAMTRVDKLKQGYMRYNSLRWSNLILTTVKSFKLYDTKHNFSLYQCPVLQNDYHSYVYADSFLKCLRLEKSNRKILEHFICKTLSIKPRRITHCIGNQRKLSLVEIAVINSAAIWYLGIFFNLFQRDHPPR